jgi:plastocyanin
MHWKKTAAVALGAAAGLSALFLPRTTHNAAAAALTAKNISISIVATGGSCTSEFCFAPESTNIRQADTVTWTNNTTTIHTVTICTTSACSGTGPGTGTDPAFNSGIIAAGASFTHAFHGTGTYNYYCQIHGFTVMHGIITVLPFAVKTATLPVGTVGTAYSTTLKAAGGDSPLTWTVSSGALPAGLKLSAAGRISGRPSASGTATFTVKVSDSSSPALSATRTLSLRVA